MSEELMLVGRGSRPAFIHSNGGRVYICVRDDNYKEEMKKWKLQLRLAHPDMGPSDVLTGHRANRNQKRTTITRTVPAYTRVVNGRTIHVPATTRVCAGGKSSSAKFRRVKGLFERWKKEEAKWYAQYNLEPPQWGK